MEGSALGHLKSETVGAGASKEGRKKSYKEIRNGQLVFVICRGGKEDVFCEKLA